MFASFRSSRRSTLQCVYAPPASRVRVSRVASASPTPPPPPPSTTRAAIIMQRHISEFRSNLQVWIQSIEVPFSLEVRVTTSCLFSTMVCTWSTRFQYHCVHPTLFTYFQYIMCAPTFSCSSSSALRCLSRAPRSSAAALRSYPHHTATHTCSSERHITQPPTPSTQHSTLT